MRTRASRKGGKDVVEIKAKGICDTDEFTLSGAVPTDLFPAVLGRERVGAVGIGVKSLEIGDHVIRLYAPNSPPPVAHYQNSAPRSAPPEPSSKRRHNLCQKGDIGSYGANKLGEDR